MNAYNPGTMATSRDSTSLQTTFQVPTKTTVGVSPGEGRAGASAGGAGDRGAIEKASTDSLGRIGGNSPKLGVGGGGMRRNSSNNSLDIAASIFSSIQSYERSGDNFNDWGTERNGAAGVGRDANGGMIINNNNNMNNMGMMLGMNINGNNIVSHQMGMGMFNQFGRFYNPTSSSSNRLSNGNVDDTPNSIFNGNQQQLQLEQMNRLALDGMFGGLQPPPFAGAMGVGQQQQQRVAVQAHLAQMNRQIEMEQMMLQQQQLNGLGGGLPNSGVIFNTNGLPMNNNDAKFNNSSSRREFKNLLEGFSREELLNEVSRRRSSRRESRNFMEEMGLGFPQQFPGIPRTNSRTLLDEMSINGLIADATAFRKRNSRDILANLSGCNSRNGLDELFGGGYGGQMEATVTGVSTKGYATDNSLDSQPSLAASVDVCGATGGGRSSITAIPTNEAPKDCTYDMSTASEHQNTLNDTTKRSDQFCVICVPTNMSSVTDKRSRDLSDEPGMNMDKERLVATAGGAADTRDKDDKNTSTAKKRSNSTSSLDTLISIFGDELAELDREKSGQAADDDAKSTSSSLSLFNQMMDQAAATAANMKNRQSLESNEAGEEDITKNNDDPRPIVCSNYGPSSARQHLNNVLDPGRKIPHAQFGMHPMYPSVSNSYANMMNMQAVGMGTLAPFEAAMLRNEQAARDNMNIAMFLQSGRGDSTAAMMSRLSGMNGIELRADERVGQNKQLTKAEVEMVNSKPKDDPAKALETFLKLYGEAAEKSKDTMLKSIEDTEASLASLHEWDRSQGLRKCHSRTVVKTRRSRAKLKAFLLGEQQPLEPKKKRSKKNREMDLQ